MQLLFAAVNLAGNATLFNATLAPGAALAVTTPGSDQIFQRGGDGTGTIYIAGTVTAPAGSYSLEARFNGGTWQTVGTIGVGAFTATLTNQTAGQGAFEIRPVNFANNTATVTNVGIGDVFVIGGQSNAQGRGSNNQAYAHATLRAGLFGNDYLWKNLIDPTDTNANQLDTVSSDFNSGGSVWPLIASYAMTNQSVPMAFIPCALSGSAITQWQAAASHTNRTTLYGSMAHRAKHALQGGVKAVLWWQGETDALNSMSTAAYQSNLTLIASNLFADLGAKLMPCKLQNSSGIGDAAEALINTAIGNAWAGNTTVIATGPDLTALASDDEYHLKSDAKLSSAAALWWTAIQTAFY